MSTLLTNIQISMANDSQLRKLVSKNPDILMKCSLENDSKAFAILDIDPHLASYIDTTKKSTPLIRACKKKCSQFANTLLCNMHTNITYCDANGHNAMYYALVNRMTDVLFKILETTPLDNNLDLRFFFDNLGHDIHTKKILNLTHVYDQVKQQPMEILIYAVSNNLSTLVTKLLNDSTIKYDYRVFQNIFVNLIKLAINNYHIVGELLKHPIDIDVIDSDGNTLLLYACNKYAQESKTINITKLNNLVETIKLLLQVEKAKEHTNVSHINKAGICALDIATKYSCQQNGSVYTDTPIKQVIVPIFKLMVRNDQNTHRLHVALSNQIKNRDTSMCFKLLELYTFDPYYIVNGKNLYSYAIEKKMFDIATKLMIDTSQMICIGVISFIVIICCIKSIF